MCQEFLKATSLSGIKRESFILISLYAHAFKSLTDYGFKEKVDTQDEDLIQCNSGISLIHGGIRGFPILLCRAKLFRMYFHIP